MAWQDDILSDIIDISEPACVDRVKFYLENLQIEDDLFMEILLDQSEDMIVTWEQPWYQYSQTLTRANALEQSEVPKQETYRTGHITKEEGEIINNNWHKFRKDFNVPNKPECLARWKSKGKSKNPKRGPHEVVRRFVIAYLAQGLERTLYQVYRYFVTHYGCPVKGPYSEAEEKVMEICFHNFSEDAVPILSHVLGREPRGIYKRFKEKTNGKPLPKRLKWTLPLATKFLKLLIQHTELPLEKLKNKRFEKRIWNKISEGMDQHDEHLQRFWYGKLHVQLFVTNDTKIRKIRRKVFKKLKDFPYTIWPDIQWKEVAKEFPDCFTHIFLYRVCAEVVRSNKSYLRAPLEEVINYALERTKTLPNRRLKRVVLNQKEELEYLFAK